MRTSERLIMPGDPDPLINHRIMNQFFIRWVLEGTQADHNRYRMFLSYEYACRTGEDDARRTIKAKREAQKPFDDSMIMY